MKVWCGHGDGKFPKDVTPILRRYVSEAMAMPPHLEKDGQGKVIGFRIYFKEGVKKFRSLVTDGTITKVVTELENKRVKIYCIGKGFKYCLSAAILQVFPGVTKVSEICGEFYVTIDEHKRSMYFERVFYV